jgi:ribose 1,5-bisphosphokinase
MKGRLIYLIGPSGSGKDTVLDAARNALTERGVRVAKRVITRSAEAVGESADAVSPEAFEALERRDAFAMSWRANGLAYGIPAQINHWLAAGDDVLVNGSRGYLPEARQRYPDLLVVLLSVKPEVLRQRLLKRNRESLEQIEARLARNARFEDSLDELFLLDNSGDLDESVNKLLRIIDR